MLGTNFLNISRESRLELENVLKHLSALLNALPRVEGEKAKSECQVQSIACCPDRDYTFYVVRIHSGPIGLLSDMQKAVAYLVSLGHTNKEVGERLGMHHQTVNSHLMRIFRKLRIESRGELSSYRLALEEVGKGLLGVSK